MKPFFRIALLCLVSLMLLTACHDDPAPTLPPTTLPTEPTHICAGEKWVMDKDNHWKICDECGNKTEVAPHTLEKDKCTACEVNITVQNDGKTLLVMPTKLLFYPFYPIWERLYDTDGRLCFERTYTYNNETSQYVIVANTYNADGSRNYALCDHYGFPTEQIFYNTKGEVTDTYTFTNQYDPGDHYPTHVACNRNGILIYKEIYSTHNDDPYRSRRTDYRPDGSYSVAKYNEKGKLKSYECFNADETPMNHSSRYDREAGRPLVGSWAVWVQSDTLTMGLYDLESRPISVLMTYTFDLNGNLLITRDLDPTEHYQYRYDAEMMMLMDWDMEEYPTLEEKEAACQEKYGKSPHEYVTDRLSGWLFEVEGHREQKGVYFVEDGLLYIADSWTTFETEMDFLISMDTLTLITDYSTTPLPLKRVSADLSEYSGRFDPETCADLFGTWTGTVKVDGKSLGFEDTELFITANVTVTFDEKGNMTMVMEMDPEEYRNFSIQLVIESIKKEYSHMDPDRLDCYYETYYGLPVAEYATAQVDAQNPAANAFAEWFGIYFIEEGLLYTVDGRTGESDGGAYSLEDGKLTIEDAEFGLSLVLTKENA